MWVESCTNIMYNCVYSPVTLMNIACVAILTGEKKNIYIYIYIHIHIYIYIYIYCHAREARKVNRRHFDGILQCFIFLGISVYIYIHIFSFASGLLWDQ